MGKKYIDVTRLTPERRAEILRLRSMSEDELFSLDTSELDQAAFGFKGEDILEIPLDMINIKYPWNLEQAQEEVPRRADSSWKAAMRYPVDITLRKGKLDLEDGHHRYVIAQRLRRPTILAKMEISDNPIRVLNTIRAASAYHVASRYLDAL